jgi:hypothetical protein
MSLPEEFALEVELGCSKLMDGYACLEIQQPVPCTACKQWAEAHITQFEARIIEVEA